MSKKLEKVLEYLIANQEDKAKELLHQVFIEKARSIHEELINMDEENMDDDGDMSDFERQLDDALAHRSKHLGDMEERIDAEETMAEDEDVDMPDAEADLGDEMSMDVADDMGNDMSNDDMSDDDMTDMDDVDADVELDSDSADVSSIEDTMSDLEDALAKLKAEFEALEAGNSDEAEEEEAEGEEEEAEGEEEEAEGEEEEAEGEEEEAEGEEEEEMDESWLQEFDDLEESLSLDTVAAPSGTEVGAGSYAKLGDSKSPVNKAPNSMLGAEPVKVKSSNVQGYERQSAPSSTEMKGTANRRKKATDGMKEVKAEKVSVPGNDKSPLSKAPRK